MVKFKSTLTPLEMSIVSNAVEVEPNRVEFGNVTFGCEEIKDASGNVFTKIIHCKNCKHHDDDGFCTGRGWPCQLVPDDGFCYLGKRRGESKDERI